jgi:hypothetical protein
MQIKPNPRRRRHDVSNDGDAVMTTMPFNSTDPVLFNSIQVMVALGILAVAFFVASFFRRHFHDLHDM